MYKFSGFHGGCYGVADFLCVSTHLTTTRCRNPEVGHHLNPDKSDTGFIEILIAVGRRVHFSLKLKAEFSKFCNI
jgi:hypothetical protein